MQYTPMIKQYLQIKQNYQDTILFFRLGDFYEMFFEDARVASRELEITLTARDGGKGKKIPMCGVPYHSADSYIAKLISKNYKVAICEQVELPGESKGIVRREVTRVITPGTLMDGQSLDDKSYNYLACVVESDNSYGLAYADITTGLFKATQFYGARSKELLWDELGRLQPKEILVCAKSIMDDTMSVKFMLSFIDREVCTVSRAGKLMERHYGSRWKQTGLEKHSLALCAAGGLLAYLYDTQKQKLCQMDMVGVYSPGEFLVLDTPTRRNLELTNSIVDGSKKGTLLSVLDFTCTAMGGRMLRSWLELPLMDINEISRRQEAVQTIKDDIFLRNRLQNLLKPIFDLERLGSKIAGGSANARDMIALKQSLKNIRPLIDVLSCAGCSLLKEISRCLDSMDDIWELLEKSIIEEPPVSVREGGIIKTGYSDEVDQLRVSATDGKKWLINLENKEKERTGIKSLKIKYNKVFGYYIEVTKANLDQVPADYIRKQTLVNAERFITPQLKEYEDLILGAEDRLVQLEYRIFSDIRNQVTAALDRLQNTAKCVAKVDALFSLAEAAVRNNFTRPELTMSKRLEIKEGRHPVVESMLGAGEYVPNDTYLDEREFISLITGPNMAGKSTYMRQVALIVLLAQVGSFVPAKEALIGITDRIFTRVGAADDLAGGRSTFMVEMSECRTIIEYGTDKSLIIMDEVGRGTSTYDGISLARAMVEYIHERIQARTLFSTHYHELTDLDRLPGVKNYTVLVQEQGEEIVFLRKLKPGKADRSYGIQVAKLAGLPEEILIRAREVLSALEENESDNISDKQCMPSVVEKPGVCEHHAGLYDIYNVILKELLETNVTQMTPLKALNTIAHWQEILLKLEKENV